MSQIEDIIVELIESRITAIDFSRILDDAISYNDDVQGHEGRIDDLENIDTESSLTEFGDRIDELERLVKDSTAAPAAPISALDRVLPPTDQSLIAGYHSARELDAYVRATLLTGEDSQAPLLIAMVTATIRNLLDAEVAKNA